MNSEAKGLDVRLSHPVHENLKIEVDFHLGREIGILFGESAAGKSTILRLIAGLVRPENGAIRLDGASLFDAGLKRNLPLRERRIGLIFQDDLLFPHLSVEANVRFGLDRWPKREAAERLAEVAALCGIGRLLVREPSTLSGGERQRVGLARALAPRPRLLLCDEPMGALDLDARFALIRRLREIQRAEPIPVLYVTHATDEAIALGDRLLLLDRGRILAEGSPIDVLSSKASHRPLAIRNVFDAVIESNPAEDSSTLLRIVGGPLIIVPKREGGPGDPVTLAIVADEIVLARGAIGPLSARNQVDGRVERLIPHGLEAEVVVKTGGVSWVVGVVQSAVEALGLIEGVEVRMIIKSRSCRVLRDDVIQSTEAMVRDRDSS